jgi:hypothetical protein
VQSAQMAAQAQAMARADPRVAALAASLLASNPAVVSSFAAANHIDNQTAAIILAKQQTPLRQMAGGGRPHKGEPVIVGEKGPEVFVPDQPGTILPQASHVPGYLPQPGQDPGGYVSGIMLPTANEAVEMTEPLGRRINPTNWDAWLASRPESENIDDQRTAEEIAWDNRVRPKLPPLVQFPPAPEEKRQ